MKNGDEVRKYVGSTVNFKKRYYGHTSSFRHESQKHATALSTHVWDKDLGPEPDIEWSILAHAPAYKLGQRNCDLCLTEKVEIAKNYSNPLYLNKAFIDGFGYLFKHVWWVVGFAVHVYWLVVGLSVGAVVASFHV